MPFYLEILKVDIAIIHFYQVFVHPRQKAVHLEYYSGHSKTSMNRHRLECHCVDVGILNFHFPLSFKLMVKPLISFTPVFTSSSFVARSSVVQILSISAPATVEYSYALIVISM